jgi:hypothetical protein
MSSHNTSGVAVISAGDDLSRAATKVPGAFDMANEVVSPPPWEPLAPPETVDDVLRNLDQVIDWSIRAHSTIGYFAALYKRTTLAIRDAIDADEFDDGPRMAQLDVIFATRYFTALNAFFLPDEHRGLTLPWEVSFVGDKDRQATMLQHMMTGMNAHITLDLGLAAFTAAPHSLDSLEQDFNRINAILASQIDGVLDIIEMRSPVVKWIRRLVPSEVFLIKRVLLKLRNGAWLFAIYMSMNSEQEIETRVNQSAWTAAVGAWYLDPPGKLTPFRHLIRIIGKHEKRNVAANIRALKPKVAEPAKMKKVYMPRKPLLRTR